MWLAPIAAAARATFSAQVAKMSSAKDAWPTSVVAEDTYTLLRLIA